jgi:hypothetical protein
MAGEAKLSLLANQLPYSDEKKSFFRSLLRAPLAPEA